VNSSRKFSYTSATSGVANLTVYLLKHFEAAASHLILMP
jgi:hypothetical protein